MSPSAKAPPRLLLPNSSNTTDNTSPHTGRPLIISASRRTDLPGYYPAVTKERIRQKVANFRTRFLYGVVFWTRYPQAFLPGGPLFRFVRDELSNPIVNLTITGLGKTPLEPNAPATKDALDCLRDLIEAFHAEPWRIRWRFDPLIKGHTSLSTFEQIAHRMTDLKIRTCTFSFPSYFSLKGNLAPTFQKAGILQWTNDEKAVFLQSMGAIAEKLGISLLSCSQPENLIQPQIQAAQCIPKNCLERGHPDHLPLKLDRDRSQRKSCNCIESVDIGDYTQDICRSGCIYCYSKAGGPEKTSEPR